MPKDGDFVVATEWDNTTYIAVCKHSTLENALSWYVGCRPGLSIMSSVGLFSYKRVRLATEQEKQTLLDALAKEGKQWNAEKKCIEPLRWKPKCGEKYYYPILYSGTGHYYDIATWQSVISDAVAWKRNIVFKTPEEAIEASKKMLQTLQ